MKQTMCFTRRLKIYTATREQMEGVIAAEADPDNIASQKVLLRCGFQLPGEIGEEGPRFVVSR